MGIISHLFTRQSHASPQKMSLAEAQKIVNTYGKAQLALRSVVSDVSQLPYPKARIKEALIIAIAGTRDATIRGNLKAAYVSLADWQEGGEIGSFPVEVGSKQLKADPLLVAKGIAAAGSTFTDIPARVAAEAQALAGELKALGL
jgi:hypothetical protein